MPSTTRSLIILTALLTIFAMTVLPAQAQTYVFGTASYSAPPLPGSISPPYGNSPVATADFNGDGMMDVAILGSTSVTSQLISIYLRKPDGTFAPRVDYPVEATGFAVGDFNGDGKLDIVAINRIGYPVASILYGNGDGTFQSAVQLNLNIGNALYSEVAAADFNGDGKLDLLLLSPNFGSGATMAIVLGNGDGTFQAPVTYSVPTAPYLAIGDFNGDGKPDVAISGPYYNSGQSDAVIILINNGDGTFQSPVSYSVSGVVEALAAGDLNGDGKLDLVVPTGGQTASVSVLLGIGDGTFAAPVSYASSLLSIYGTSIALADFNGDGRLDVALSNANGNGVAILLGNGDGTFQSPPQSYSAGLDPASIMALDVNGDGKPDLVVTGGSGLTAIVNRGDGSFSKNSTYPVVKFPWKAVGGDFNGDARPDIAVGTITTTAGGQYNGGVVSVLASNSDGTFQPRVDTTTTTFPMVLAPGDFNGDGKLDLVVDEETPYTNYLSTWIGNGDGTFQTNISQSIPGSVGSLAVGDFNNDGKLDVAATIGGVYVFLGNGDGTFNAPVVTSAPSAGTLRAADFNGDGKLDLAISGGQSVSVLLGNGDGTFQPSTFSLSGQTLLAVGDFNGDGRPDLCVVSATNVVSVALGNGDGTFAQAAGFQLPSILGTTSPIVGDFNGDGKLDLAISSESENVVTLLLGNGDGTFKTLLSYATDEVPALVAADYNGDGALDLAMTDVTNQTVAVMLNSPVAAFAPSPVAFGNQLVGASSSQQTVTLTNPGAGPLTISDIVSNGDFATTSDCGATLAIGASCHVNVTFEPTATGDRTGTLTFTDNGSVVPQVIPLSGTGVAPAAALTTTGLTFPAQLIGTTSNGQGVTLSNTGTAPLTLASIGVSGDFAQTNTCGSSVAAGTNCTIDVTFAPTATGNRTGALSIGDNAPGSPQIVSLSGAGMGSLTITASSGSMTYGGAVPAITASYSGFVGGDSPSSLTTPPTCTTTATRSSPVGTYPTTCSGAVDASYTIDYAQGTITVGAASLTITASSGSFVYGGTVPTITPNYSGFVNGDSVASLTTPATCSSLATSSSPVSGSPYASSCTGAADGNYTIHYVSGSVIESQATLTISAPSPGMNEGASVPTLTPTYGGFVNGDTAASLSTAPTCTTKATSSSIGGSYPVTCAGAVDGNYSINYVAGNLTVTGPGLSLSSSSLTFAAQTSGSTSTAQSVSVSNTGNANLTFTGISTSGPFAVASSGTTCSSSTPLAANTSCTVAVTFSPTTGGALSGSISLADNVVGGPQTIALSGTGEDFSFGAASGSSTTSTVGPGGTATYTLSDGSEGGLTGSVTFTVSGVPSEAACTVSPNPAPVGTSATMTCTTTAPSVGFPRPRTLPPIPPPSAIWKVLLLLALLLAATAWAAGWTRLAAWRPRTAMLSLAAGLLLLLVMAGCGGGGGGGGGAPSNPGTPAGTYTLTVTGTVGTGASAVSHNVTLTLTVS
jgi:hypothetical protein